MLKSYFQHGSAIFSTRRLAQLVVLLTASIYWMGASAQVIVANGGFDRTTSGCLPACYFPSYEFAYGCVGGWFPSHGTVFRLLQRPNYNNYAAVFAAGTDPNGVNPPMGSGIYANVSLKQGVGYTLKFSARTDYAAAVNQTVNFSLVSGLTPGSSFNYPSCPSPYPFQGTQPSPTQQITLTQQVVTANFTDYTVHFTAPFWQGTQLWINVPFTANFTNPYYDYRVDVDDVSLTQDLMVTLSDPVVKPQLDDSYRVSTQSTASGGSGSYTYAWQVDYYDGLGFRSVTNTSSAFSTTISNPQQQLAIKVIVSDGTTQAQAILTTAGGSATSRQAVAYPNPADLSVSITREPENTEQPVSSLEQSSKNAARASKGLTTEPISVQVYNSKGLLQYSGVMSGNKAELNTSTWPNGLYYARMVSGETVKHQQIIVKH